MVKALIVKKGDRRIWEIREVCITSLNVVGKVFCNYLTMTKKNYCMKSRLV